MVMLLISLASEHFICVHFICCQTKRTVWPFRSVQYTIYMSVAMAFFFFFFFFGIQYRKRWDNLLEGVEFYFTRRLEMVPRRQTNRADGMRRCPPLSESFEWPLFYFVIRVCLCMCFCIGLAFAFRFCFFFFLFFFSRL